MSYDSKVAREMMSVVELAKYLRVSRHTIYQWISECKLPFSYYKFSRGVRFDCKEVDQWLETRKIKPVDSFN